MTSYQRKELLGVIVELIGDVFVVVGYTGQRLATLDDSDIESEEGNSGEELKAFQKCRSLVCSNPKWLASFLVFALGQALELVALGLASESTVVAIGNLSLVFNALASVYVFGEDFAVLPRYSGRYTFYQWDGFNLLLLIVGSASAVAFAPVPSASEESELDADELRKMWMETPFAYFNILMILAMGTLGTLCYRNFRNKDENKAPMFLASSTAILAAFSVTLSKVVTELLSKTMAGDNQFRDLGAMFMTLIWIFGLVTQLILLNIGLRNFEQGVFIPMFETMSTSITIVFGVAYFKSYKDFHQPAKLAGFCVGVVLLVIGLFLSSRRHSPSREEMLARLNERSPRAGHKPIGFSDRSEHLLANDAEHGEISLE